MVLLAPCKRRFGKIRFYSELDSTMLLALYVKILYSRAVSLSMIVFYFPS